jgi:hypothetical protein
MPYKHLVYDKFGKAHTRTSAERKYPFAVIRHWEAYDFGSDGDPNFARREILAGASATWCSRADLAQAQARAARSRNHTSDVEIIPCVPVATGKHKAQTAGSK